MISDSGVIIDPVLDTTVCTGAGNCIPANSMMSRISVAMVPGVVVSYYTEYLKSKENETISTFLEKLEHLPELSKEELTELSEKVKKFNNKK